MGHFWLDLWQQLTRQVCMCKHTKRHHIILSEKFAKRSDVQCMDFVFTGGAYGEHGLLGCCQCLSYHKQQLPFKRWFWKLKRLGKSQKSNQDTTKNCFCVCGHSAYDHDIGTPEMKIHPMYPPCTKCDCSQYDYVDNPHIGDDVI
jgi:hypothetical protein